MNTLVPFSFRFAVTFRGNVPLGDIHFSFARRVYTVSLTCFKVPLDCNHLPFFHRISVLSVIYCQFDPKSHPTKLAGMFLTFHRPPSLPV